MREIMFDVETTGFHHGGDDRIVEVGAVECVNFMPTGEVFQMYVNPARPIPEEVIRVHGITDEKVADAPRFEDPDVVDALLAFFGDSPIVAHNANFDRSFLNAELRRCGRDPIASTRFIDTAAMARKKFPGSPASLDALCRRFNISTEARTYHGALLDSRLLADVYLELNGGRLRSFEFRVSDAERAAAPGGNDAPRQRETPLKPLLTEAERAAHARFVETLGSADTPAVWKRLAEDVAG